MFLLTFTLCRNKLVQALGAWFPHRNELLTCHNCGRVQCVHYFKPINPFFFLENGNIDQVVSLLRLYITWTALADGLGRFILERLFTILVACASLWVLQECTPTAVIYVVSVFVLRELKDDMRFSTKEEKSFKFMYLWKCLKLENT